ncbi:MAG: DUF5991 domain-containing protein [Pyrinomonadaceae bacterium]
MLKITNNFSVLFLIFLFSIFTNAQATWIGSYEFDEDGGKTVGGSAIFITHELEIKQTGDGILATIQSSGYQTSTNLVGTVKTEGDKLMIYFDSYGENNMFEKYEQGDLLFTLEKKMTKGKTEILTFWNKFEPVIDKNQKSGKVYFKENSEKG